MHYQDEEDFMDENKDEFDNEDKDGFFNKMLFFEVLILAMHPIPFYDKYIVFHSKNWTIVYF